MKQALEKRSLPRKSTTVLNMDENKIATINGGMTRDQESQQRQQQSKLA
jgi:hypothetical protein